MPELITLGETLAAFAPTEAIGQRQPLDFKLRIAGAESNTAIGLRRLGHTTGWISRLGSDAFGQFVLDTIQAEGVETADVIRDSQHQTAVMFKQPISNNETRVNYYRAQSAASHLSTADLRPGFLQQAKILHLTGITPVLSRSCRACVEAAMQQALAQQVMVSFDPNLRLKLWGDTDFRPMLRAFLLQADIALLGLEEADQLFGTSDVPTIFTRLFEGRVRFAAIKCSSDGAWVATREERHFIPPVPCHCIDPVGAGDGFNAGFLCALLEGRSIQECGQFGAVVGAMATETRGDIEGYPTREALQQKLDPSATQYTNR